MTVRPSPSTQGAPPAAPEPPAAAPRSHPPAVVPRPTGRAELEAQQKRYMDERFGRNRPTSRDRHD